MIVQFYDNIYNVSKVLHLDIINCWGDRYNRVLFFMLKVSISYKIKSNCIFPLTPYFMPSNLPEAVCIYIFSLSPHLSSYSPLPHPTHAFLLPFKITSPLHYSGSHLPSLDIHLNLLTLNSTSNFLSYSNFLSSYSYANSISTRINLC